MLCISVVRTWCSLCLGWECAKSPTFLTISSLPLSPHHLSVYQSPVCVQLCCYSLLSLPLSPHLPLSLLSLSSLSLATLKSKRGEVVVTAHYVHAGEDGGEVRDLRGEEGDNGERDARGERIAAISEYTTLRSPYLGINQSRTREVTNLTARHAPVRAVTCVTQR